MLNVTPDSFTDGGRYLDPGRATAHAETLLQEGADALDVGAESTRPGHVPVPPDIEWQRLAPVLRRLRATLPSHVPLSVDTRHAEVARRALDVGVDAVNDVSGLGDPDMLAAVVHGQGSLIVGHWRRGEPADPAAVAHTLKELAHRAEAYGLPPENLAVDPGLGFSKAARVSWQLLAALPSLTSLGYAVVVGASRKGFVQTLAGAVFPEATDVNRVEDWDVVTAAITFHAASCGVALVRVHAPHPSRLAVAAARALATASPYARPDPSVPPP